MAAEQANPPEWPPRIAVCVGTVVLQEERALFVCQAKGHSLEGLWSIPWGLVDPKESPDAAALRETLEEGGVSASIEGLLGVQNLRQEGWVAILFLWRHVSGTPTPDGGVETDGARYFSRAEMDTFDEPFEPWCEWLVHRVLAGAYYLIPPEGDNPYRPRVAFL